LSLFAMDCLQVSMASCSKNSLLTFWSLSHISCNPTNDNRRLVSNLCLEFCIYILQHSFLYKQVQIQIWWCFAKMLWIWICWHDANEKKLS
jgi:hypothetical protein